jgi:hypothetical protein
LIRAVHGWLQVSCVVSRDRNPRPGPMTADGREIWPMSLRNMREHSVRAVMATCQESSCGQAGSLNVDDLPDDLAVPDVSLRLRCSRCGSRNVKTQPDWREGQWARNYGRSPRSGAHSCLSDTTNTLSWSRLMAAAVRFAWARARAQQISGRA